MVRHTRRQTYIPSESSNEREYTSSSERGNEEEDINEFFEDVEDWREETLVRLKNKSPEIYKNFIRAQEYLEKETPSIDEVMSAKLTLRDRARLLETYEMMIMTPPLTFDWQYIKRDLITQFKTAKRNAEQLDKLNDVEEQLEELENVKEMSIEYSIITLNLPAKYKSLLYSKYQTLQAMDQYNDEYAKLQEWIRRILTIPWGVHRHIDSNRFGDVIRNLKTELDSEFYGMTEVKEQLLLYVHNRLYYPNTRDYALGLIGPAGVGKTSIVRALAKILSFPFHQVSGGVLQHNDHIYGHSYTYIGSDIGEISKACVKMNAMNGIIFIDEFEKIPLDKCLSTLLHLLDPEQNHIFYDRYIGDIPIDLSQMWFILSMNNLPEDKALSDRIYTIKLEKYSRVDKVNILERYTIPKFTRHLSVNFTREAVEFIVNHSGGDDGMRGCIHLVRDVVRKLGFIQTNPDIETTFKTEWTPVITETMLRKLVSQPKISNFLHFYG